MNNDDIINHDPDDVFSVNEIIERDPDDVTADEYRRIIEILEKCLAAGFIIDSGEVRKVLGTLPLTADDVICGIGSIVYTDQGTAWQACVHNAAHEPSRCEGSDPSTPLHQCYSTREAAAAAVRGEVKHGPG
jgi:hypothetical protein